MEIMRAGKNILRIRNIIPKLLNVKEKAKLPTSKKINNACTSKGAALKLFIGFFLKALKLRTNKIKFSIDAKRAFTLCASKNSGLYKKVKTFRG